MSKENVEVLKKLFEAGPRGDIAAIRKYVAADTEWSEAISPEIPQWSAGTYKGLDVVLRDVIGVATSLFDKFRLEVDEFIDVGPDRVISVGHFRGKAKNTGKELDSEFVMISTIKNGQVYRHHNTCDTAAWLRALGLELGKRVTLPLKQPVATAPH